MYKLYKNEFSRLSVTSAEEKIRYAAFNDYQEGGKTYMVGLNKFADWTPEELNNLRGLRRPEGEISSTNAKSNQRFFDIGWERGAKQNNHHTFFVRFNSTSCRWNKYTRCKSESVTYNQTY